MRYKIFLFILTLSLSGFSQYTEDESDYSYYEESDDEELRIDKEYEVIPGEEVYNHISPNSEYKSDYQGEEFTYYEDVPEEKEAKEPLELPKDNRKELRFDGWPRFFMNLLLVLAIGLLLFLIFKLAQNFNYRPANKALEKTEFESDEEEIVEEKIDKSSLNYLIAKAKEDKNYALAIRYYFLLYLNTLQDLKLVEFHIDKTNADYLAEIKDDERIMEFTQVSYLFEHVWYGKKVLNQKSFEFLEQQFTQKINTK